MELLRIIIIVLLILINLLCFYTIMLFVSIKENRKLLDKFIDSGMESKDFAESTIPRSPVLSEFNANTIRSLVYLFRYKLVFGCGNISLF